MFIRDQVFVIKADYERWIKTQYVGSFYHVTDRQMKIVDRRDFLPVGLSMLILKQPFDDNTL
jgi:hypothetical protein